MVSSRGFFYTIAAFDHNHHSIQKAAMSRTGRLYVKVSALYSFQLAGNCSMFIWHTIVCLPVKGIYEERPATKIPPSEKEAQI